MNEKAMRSNELSDEMKASCDGEVQDRKELLALYQKLKAQNTELKREASQYERCAPERVEEMKVNTKICKQACDRWVDNIYCVTDWIKKK